MDRTTYTDAGYTNRRAYLCSLSESMGVDLQIVLMMAGLLGPSEDFDGLVTALDDYIEDCEGEF